jgi:tRNA A37 N6-isopentenylltransferase MiaA
LARIRNCARNWSELDPKNRRRLIRALEIIEAVGSVPPRASTTVLSGTRLNLVPKWIIIDPPREELRTRIDARLASALERGLVDEVRRVRAQTDDTRLNELGLEYRVIGEFLNLEEWPPLGGHSSKLLFQTLSAKLWQYARRQKAWLRKLGHPMS